jgi:hypothetical protein
MLAVAGAGLVLVALFHLMPLGLDAAAIRILFAPGVAHGPMRNALLTRWVGESANSLMPAGQLGGPVLMARHLALQGMPMPNAAAAIIVSTTLQTFAQIGFALIGVSLLGAHASGISEDTLRHSSDEAGVRRLAVLVAGYVKRNLGSMPHEEAVRDLILEGGRVFEVTDVTGAPWIEIDFSADVSRAEREILPELQSLPGVAT